MNIKNYKYYACFDYISNKSKFHKLGDVVINEENQIGIIIQIHSDLEFRTDMFGNCCISEIVMASDEQIKKFRPNIKDEIHEFSIVKKK